MKSDLFKNITEDMMDESYDPRFIKYLASVAIYYCKDEKCSLDYLTKSLEKHYGNTIKTSTKLRNFLNDLFSKNGTNGFIISEDEKTIINFINLLRKRINNLAMYSDEQLYFELCRYIQDENSKFIDIYSYFSALEITSNLNMNLEIILFKIYTLLEERFIEKDKYNERYEIILNINPAYDELNIKNIIKDEPCLNILSISNVNQIKQIKRVKRNLIDLVFIFDNNFFEICKLLTKTINNSLEDLKNDYYERIKEKEDDMNGNFIGYNIVGTHWCNGIPMNSTNTKGTMKLLTNTSESTNVCNGFSAGLLLKYTYPKFPIIKEETKNGTIEIDKEAIAGTTVKLKIKAKTGFYADEIIVTDENGNKIEVKDNSFVMPEGKVNVRVIFKRIINPETLSTISIIVIIALLMFIGTIITIKKKKRMI